MRTFEYQSITASAFFKDDCSHCSAQAPVTQTVMRLFGHIVLRWGPYTCPQRRHRWPAEGVETTSWLSSSNMAAYRQERPQTIESGAVIGPAQSLW